MSNKITNYVKAYKLLDEAYDDLLEDFTNLRREKEESEIECRKAVEAIAEDRDLIIESWDELYEVCAVVLTYIQ